VIGCEYFLQNDLSGIGRGVVILYSLIHLVIMLLRATDSDF